METATTWNNTGNGTLPLIWVAISTVLSLALNERNHGGVFRAPITKLLTSLAGFTFVDNTNLLNNQHRSDETIVEIFGDLQWSLDVQQGTL